MDNKYMFFCLPSKEVSATIKFEKVLERYDIEIFSPRISQLKKHSAKIFIYIFWLFATKGQYKIVYVKKDNVIIHYTHILPRFFKFPFMQVKDLEVGPAWTNELYRGKGIFTAVIGYVTQYFKEEERTFYAFAHVDNSSSQKAILKAGFKKWANGYKTDKLGIYRVEKNE